MIIRLMRATLRRWVPIYLITIVITSIFVFIIFRNASYPTGQVAMSIALPVFVSILAIKIVMYFSPTKVRGEELHTKKIPLSEKPPTWFMVTLGTFMIIFIISCVLAILMFVSSAIYPLIGLNWATDVSLHIVAIPSAIIAGISLCCISLIPIFFIVKPYWKKIITIIRKRLSLFSEVTQEIHINGYKIPVHR
jgi:hypothetical protein